MKTIKRIAVIAISLVLFLGMGIWCKGFGGEVIAKAAEAGTEGDLDPIEKGGEYTYKVTIYSGKEGHFSDGSTVKTVSATYGKPYPIDLNSLGLIVEHPDEYYPRGLKKAGHDNDEDFVSYTFPNGITEDCSFAVSYGIKGGMVKYVVNYLDANGNPLEKSEEFYGMVGDDPVVSYKYVSGYRPDAYNKGKTLVADETENVFNFTYTRLAQPTPTPAATASTTGGTTTTGTTTTGTNPANNIANIPGTTGANNAADNTGNNAAAGNAADNNTAGNAADNNAAANAADTNAAGTTEAAGNGAAPSENAAGNTGVIEEAAQNVAEATPEAENTEPIEYIDLDEEEVPLAGVDDAAKEDAEAGEADDAAVEEARSGVSPVVWVVAGVAAAAVIGAIAYNSSKRKAEGDEDEEDDSDLDE